jgi:myosin I
MSQEHSREFGLQGQTLATNQFTFTSQSGCDTVEGIDDVKEFTETIDAMSTMGFDQTEQTIVLKTVLAVLFLGNIQFKENDKDESSVTNRDALDFTAYLLNVDSSALEAALVSRTMTSGVIC